MYHLCEKYYKPITVQYYIADCASWVPRLTLLDLQTNWLTNVLSGRNSYVGDLLYITTYFLSLADLLGLKAAADLPWEWARLPGSWGAPVRLGWCLWLVSILIGQSICFRLAIAHALPVLKYSQYQPREQVTMLYSWYLYISSVSWRRFPVSEFDWMKVTFGQFQYGGEKVAKHCEIDV